MNFKLITLSTVAAGALLLSACGEAPKTNTSNANAKPANAATPAAATTPAANAPAPAGNTATTAPAPAANANKPANAPAAGDMKKDDKSVSDSKDGAANKAPEAKADDKKEEKK